MNLLLVFIAALTLSFAHENYCTLSGGRYSIISVSSGNYLYGKPYWHVIKLKNGKYALKSVSSGNYLQSMPNVAANAILGAKGVDISEDIINLQWTFIATKNGINGINADCNIIRIRSVSSGSSEFDLSDIGGEKQWKLARHGVRRSLIESGVKLSIRETNSYWRVWNDYGSGADDDVSFWRPKLSSGEAFLSFVATDSKYTEPTSIFSTVISSYPAGSLADPISFSLIWNDGGSGADKDVSWWRAKGPVDYVCFGDFVLASHSTPNIPSDLGGYKCVHKDYVFDLKDEGFATKKVWDDSGSGADMDGAVYQMSKIIFTNEYPKYYYKMESDMKSGEIKPYYALNTLYIEASVAAPSVPSYVVKFAPKWLFKNSNGNGYPMNPQIFYQFMISPEPASTTVTNAALGHYYEWSKENGNVYLENNDFSAIYDGLVPTLFAINRCAGGRIHILYYIPYGYQHSCSTCFEKGAHQGAFELVTVVLTEDATNIFGVYFKQHKGHYFKTKNEVDFDGTHPKVYVGKYAHGTYDYSQPNEVTIDALYWDDPRNGDKQWIPNINELYDITNIENNNYEAPMWNGLPMEWMKFDSEEEFPDSAHESKQKYGKEFFQYIGKLPHDVCDIEACKGQQLIGQEGCAKCSCFDGTKYTDIVKDNPFRCKEGCGSGRQAFGDECCKTEMGIPYKCKDRVDYARNNQPFEI